MEVIFTTVRNEVDRDDTRTGIVIDHSKPYKNLKGKPCTHRNAWGSVPKLGAFFGSNGPLPYIPQYQKIGDKSIAVEPAVMDKQGKEITPEKVHEIEIISGTIVLLDGYFVAETPRLHNNGKKLSVPEKLKFCRAVVWQLLNDAGTLKETLDNIGTIHMPENICERVQTAIAAPIVAPIPAEIPAVSEPIAVEIPEELNAYTHEAITGYPATKDTRGYDLTPVERHDLMEMNWEEGDMDAGYDVYDTAFLDDIEKESIGEMYAAFGAFNPAPVQVQNVVRSWSMPHIRCTIMEVTA